MGWAVAPVVDSSGCPALWRRRGVRGRGGCGTCAAHGGVKDGQGQSEEVEREGVRACAGGGNSAGASQASPVASEKIADLGLRASQIHDSVHKNNS